MRTGTFLSKTHLDVAPWGDRNRQVGLPRQGRKPGGRNDLGMEYDGFRDSSRSRSARGSARDRREDPGNHFTDKCSAPRRSQATGQVVAPDRAEAVGAAGHVEKATRSPRVEIRQGLRGSVERSFASQCSTLIHDGNEPAKKLNREAGAAEDLP